MTRSIDPSIWDQGGKVAIVGGGPGGAACAIALSRQARRMGVDIRTFLIEAKEFDTEFNQCLGVLSPPLRETLRSQLGIVLPQEMLQRRIQGYMLYSDRDSIFLPTDPEEEATFAIRRVELDRFLLQRAEEHGAIVVGSRAYDLEFDSDGVTVYCDIGSLKADVLVGAFGLEPTMAEALSRRAGYRPPPCLETVVTKVHPGGLDAIPGLLDDTIHVFLPSFGPVEFGALTPKANHISIVIAGPRVKVRDMRAFLEVPGVRKLLPERYEVRDFFKGTFPVGLARKPFGHRYVTVGDAAGLVRPYKGKGIYSAVVTGIRAARTILKMGFTQEAFRHYYAECHELTSDVFYGRMARRLTLLLSKRVSFDPVIALAKEDADFKRALFLAVSGHGTYRTILLECLRPQIVGRFLRSVGRYYLSELGRSRPESVQVP